jgi:hypothetical protein
LTRFHFILFSIPYKKRRVIYEQYAPRKNCNTGVYKSSYFWRKSGKTMIGLRIFLLMASISVMLGCSWLGVTDAPESKTVGWRPAGLEFPDASNTGGAQRMIAVGDYLLVMDAYYPPFNIQDTTERRYSWRLWQGKDGSDNWKQIQLPNGEIPNEMLSHEGRAIIGTKYTGRIYSYNPENMGFESIRPPSSYYELDSFKTVHSLGVYQDKLVVGMLRPSGTDQLFFWFNGAEGIRIPGTSNSKKWPMDQVIEHQGFLYGIQNQAGVFRWKPGMEEQEQLPSPRGRTNPNEDEFVSAITVHDDHIIVGYSTYQDGIYRLEDDDTWTNLTPLNSQGTTRDAPRDVRVLLSYKGRLFAAGVEGGALLVHAPRNPDCPDFGDWKLVSNNACKGQEGCWDGVSSQTWGVVGVGDMLYQSWWRYVIKLPFSQVDEISHPVFKEAAMLAHESTCPEL